MGQNYSFSCHIWYGWLILHDLDSNIIQDNVRKAHVEEHNIFDIRKIPLIHSVFFDSSTIIQSIHKWNDKKNHLSSVIRTICNAKEFRMNKNQWWTTWISIKMKTASRSLELSMKPKTITSPRNFLTIPSEKLAIVMNLGTINDAQKLAYRKLSGEKFILRDISLKRPRQIRVNCARMQQKANNWILFTSQFHRNCFCHCSCKKQRHITVNRTNGLMRKKNKRLHFGKGPILVFFSYTNLYCLGFKTTIMYVNFQPLK